MIQRHLMMRVLKAASHVGFTLVVSKTLGRRGFKSCAHLLVVISFPKRTAPYYDYPVAVDGRR